MTGRIRSTIRQARLRGDAWVRVIDLLRALGSSEGRARVWTGLAHRGQLHQTRGTTSPDRYPKLFDLCARLEPDAKRILSFGCSTGEELEAIRRRFPRAEIVGAEINARSRRIAARRTHADALSSVVPPSGIGGEFDIIFALAVLQVAPDWVAAGDIADLSGIYPFRRFDEEIGRLSGRLAQGGLLCVTNAQYRVEDSDAFGALQAVSESPPLPSPIFAADGRRYEAQVTGRTVFRKVSAGQPL